MGSEGLGAGCDGVGLPGILQLRCTDQSPHPERDFACFFFGCFENFLYSLIGCRYESVATGIFTGLVCRSQPRSG